MVLKNCTASDDLCCSGAILINFFQSFWHRLASTSSTDDSVHTSCHANHRPNGIATSNFGIERITGNNNSVLDNYYQFAAMLSSRNSPTVRSISDLKCELVLKRISRTSCKNPFSETNIASGVSVGIFLHMVGEFCKSLEN